MKRATIFNKIFTKKCLKELVFFIFQYYGSERSLELMEHLKNLGFRQIHAPRPGPKKHPNMTPKWLQKLAPGALKIRIKSDA